MNVVVQTDKADECACTYSK